MRVQTFLGKVDVESLHQTDEHINEWLKAHQAEVKLVSQCFGYERNHEGACQDPVVVTSIWY